MIWTQSELQRYIDDAIPESLNLDYKAAGSLAKTDGKRAEVTKDVSAMANSDGGIIIYGILEDKTVAPPVPSEITPIDAADITKEWLDQTINNIRPRLEGVIIHPVQLSSAPNHFAYVVEIPQSTTAHQALDKRYYKRFNFLSSPMDDYEIRDVMGRSQHPQVDLTFEIRPKYTENQEGSRIDNCYVLVGTIRNTGLVLANHIITVVKYPKGIRGGGIVISKRKPLAIDGMEYGQLHTDNLNKETGASNVLLPNLERIWIEMDLKKGFNIEIQGELRVFWSTHADNARPVEHEAKLKDLPFEVMPDRE